MSKISIKDWIFISIHEIPKNSLELFLLKNGKTTLITSIYSNISVYIGVIYIKFLENY